jgi:hypothetical protein
LSKGSQTKYILGPSIPDPLGSVTFGLCGSVYFLRIWIRPILYKIMLTIRSLTYIYFSVKSPVAFTGLYDDCYSKVVFYKVLLVNNHWEMGRILIRIRIWAIKSEYGYKDPDRIRAKILLIQNNAWPIPPQNLRSQSIVISSRSYCLVLDLGVL